MADSAFEDIAHLIAMPNVTREAIDALVDDVLNDQAQGGPASE